MRQPPGAPQAMLHGIGRTPRGPQKAQVGIAGVWLEGNTFNTHALELAAEEKRGSISSRDRSEQLVGLMRATLPAVNPQLARRFERVERHKQELLESLAGRDDAWLNRAPAPGAWSVVQVISHLILSEVGTLSYIGKKIQAPPEEIPDAGLPSLLRYWALWAALRSPLRRQAPMGVRPAGDPDSLGAVSARWGEERARWRERLETYPEALMGKAIFRHPFAGRLSMTRTLCFLDDHLQHHARQIGRNGAALG